MTLTLFKDTFLYPDNTYTIPDMSRFFPATSIPTEVNEIDNYIVNYILNESAWMNASTEKKEQALRGATFFLDDRRWKSETILKNQELSWPRMEFRYDDSAYGSTITVNRGTIPPRLKKAIELVALYILSDMPKNALFLNETDNYDSIRMTDVEWTGPSISRLEKILIGLEPLFEIPQLLIKQ